VTPTVTTMERTLTERLEAAAASDGHITFLAGPTPQRVSLTELHHTARRLAGELAAAGVVPGDHVAVLGDNSRSVATAVQAVWLAGAVVVILPLPARVRSIDDLVPPTVSRVAAAEASVVLMDETFEGLGDELRPRLDGSARCLGLSGLLAAAKRRHDSFDIVTGTPGDPAILQFTSGSTAEPRGAVISGRALCHNIDAIGARSGWSAGDTAVSWLPLYHDMGLVGLLAMPMLVGMRLVLASPAQFVRRPRAWLEWITQYRGTITSAPSFAYALAVRRSGSLDGLDLSSLRFAYNGAEPIDPTAFHRFVQAGRAAGLAPSSAYCVYGLAEATLAVTIPHPGSGIRSDTVASGGLERHQRALPATRADQATTTLARLGPPIPGVEVRVTDPGREVELPERHVGEIHVAGPSVMDGYFRQPEATARSLDDGWLHTGDLGYLVDGELVICGRLKDMIIVGGRNILPTDIERSVAGVPGVRAGNVIAFGIDAGGRERVVVVAEVLDGTGREVLDAIRTTVRAKLEVALHDIVIAPKGTIPKTTSGKLQRPLCKQRYNTGQLSSTA
jgi:fatty-acyl-CoA synthase